MENLVNTAVSEYGRLEVMVNNAGIFSGLHTIVDENRRRPHHARQLQERMAGQQVRDPADAAPGPGRRVTGTRRQHRLDRRPGRLAAEPGYCAAKGAVVNSLPSTSPPNASTSTPYTGPWTVSSRCPVVRGPTCRRRRPKLPLQPSPTASGASSPQWAATNDEPPRTASTRPLGVNPGLRFVSSLTTSPARGFHATEIAM